MAFQGLYVHIPFCRSRCCYCDFFSYGSQGAEESALAALKECYANYVCREISLWHGQGQLKSLYIGGGTPTVLPAQDLTKIVDAACRHLDLRPEAEITVEANPATVDLADLCFLKDGGFNRLSLGAQSFQPAELQAMGRLHSPGDIKKTVKEAREAGFENIGIDLIYGLPGQSLTSWENTLEEALVLSTPHISLYSLSVDNNSPWGKLYTKGELALPDEDLVADMFQLAIDKLNQAGILQYEIANFARPGFASRHNSIYWQRFDYLGVGLAAASCQGKRRWVNKTDHKAWQNAIDQKLFPPAEEEVLSEAMALAEKVFLGLRLLSGIKIQEIKQEFHIDIQVYYKEEFDNLEKNGLIQKTSAGYSLTPRGVFLGNLVFAAFLPEK